MTAPLVSILIPVRSARFFAPALASALAQVSVDIEVIVSDDSENDDVKTLVTECDDARVRYLRNTPALGFHGNFANCYTLARGKYLKFLNHDDLLHPECAARMVIPFEKFGERLALVCSRRQIIDEAGKILPDSAATHPLAEKDSILPGTSFANHLLQRSVNLIGEPSATMFRKSDIHLIDDTLFCIQQHRYMCLADLALWLRLLAKGDMGYLIEPLSYIRKHSGQLQQSSEVAATCITERFYLPRDARTLGFLSNDADYKSVLNNGINLVRQGLGSPGVAKAARVILQQTEDVISRGK